MGKYAKVLTKKTAIVFSTVLIIAVMLIGTTMPVLGTTSPTSVSDKTWAERATWALTKARHAIGYAIDTIIEQAEMGNNVSLAKNTLKASIIIYGAAERAFGEGHYKKAFFLAVLSALVARDSARIAVEGPETIDVIMDEVEEKIEQVGLFIDNLEETGVDVSLARKVLEFAEKLHTKAQEVVDEMPVRAVVATEASRIVAYVAGMIAWRS